MQRIKRVFSFRATAAGLTLGCVSVALIGIGSSLFGTDRPSLDVLMRPLRTPNSTVIAVKPEPVDVLLTRDTITQLLARLDQAKRHKNPDGILEHISHDAIITIHIISGAQQQTARLSRAEYGTIMQKGFTLSTGDDYTRVNTSIILAPDETSATVSYKSVETVSHDRPKLKSEGEESLVFGIRNGKPMIIAIDQFVPGDVT